MRERLLRCGVQLLLARGDAPHGVRVACAAVGVLVVPHVSQRDLEAVARLARAPVLADLADLSPSCAARSAPLALEVHERGGGSTEEVRLVVTLAAEAVAASGRAEQGPQYMLRRARTRSHIDHAPAANAAQPRLTVELRRPAGSRP